MANPELPIPDGLVLRPFHGVRFAVDDLAEVTSPPYDLIAENDVRGLLDSHPNNVVRLILPGADRHRYAEAREILGSWLSSGVLVVDRTPAVYVYEQAGKGVLQRGLIGDVGLAAPERRVILPHEDVMPGPVADRLALMRTTEANLEPIFLLYEGRGGAATRLVDRVAATRPPLTEAETRDGVRHRLWAVTDLAELSELDADLRARSALIADGHHRYATYRALQAEHRTTGSRAEGDGPGPWDFGLALLVDVEAYPPDLKAIHRVIPDLPLDEAVARARGAWQVHEHPDLAKGLAALEETTGPAFLLSDGAPRTCSAIPTPASSSTPCPRTGPPGGAR